MAADAIRLMVLATVQHLEPATGYAVRKHLLDQGADSWGGVSVASIYSVLRTLTRHGHLEELDDPTGVRERTKAFRTTRSGEKELQSLWRNAIETVDAARPLAFHVAITLTALVSHADYVDALRNRLATVERLATFPLPEDPPQVANAARLWRELGAAEARWLAETIERADAFEYAAR
jgi:DNA-binding PadR family transcriptional regulator